MALESRLLSPKEQPLFVLGLLFSGFVWLVVFISIIGALYAVLVLAALLMAHALFLANVKGNGLRISEEQNPELFERIKAASARLGLRDVPDVYLLQQGGVLNAFATKLLARRFVVIYSDLLDSCEDPRQVDFIIGHELGHLAAGHLTWNLVLAPFRLVPWLGPAYSRACEYTCDRVGLEVARDLEQSKRALVVLAAGGKQAARANLEAFVRQREEAGGFWMAIYELVSSYPYLCKRVAALQELTVPGSVPAVPRNPVAYPLAPLLGVAAGGSSAIMLVVVVYVAIAAVFGARAFERYREAALRATTIAPAAYQRPLPDYDPGSSGE